MARYVEVDELKAKINANAWSNPVVPIYVNKVIDRTPTADVAPRSEVAREIFDELKAEISVALSSNYDVRRQTAESRLTAENREAIITYLDGKINALKGLEGFIEEIETKYMEEQK